MIVRSLPALIFGSVVLESNLTGCTVRIYSDDLTSYSMHTKPRVELKLPLDELREKITIDKSKELAYAILKDVEKELDETYPGGLEKATSELSTWLCN